MRALIWATVVGVITFLITYAIASGVLAVLMGSLALLAAYGYFKGKLYLGPTSLVDVLAFVISIASLYIALASYQEAQKSGAEQQRSLEASRKALESVIETANKQKNLLEENLKTASTHLTLVQQQRAEEIRRLARKPRVEIGLGKLSSKQLKALEHINVAVDKNNIATFDFVVTNIGDAPVTQPVVLIIAEPGTVFLDPRGNRVSERDNHNMVQFSGSTTLDLLPFEMSRRPYRYSIDAVVPPPVKEFNLHFTIYGANLSLLDVMLAARDNSPRFARENTDDYKVTGLVLAKMIREIDAQTPIFFFTQTSNTRLKERIETVCQTIPNTGVLFKYEFDDPITFVERLDALLTEGHNQTTPNSLLDALRKSLILQPNFAGIGIDLKEMAKGLKRKRKMAN